MSKLSGFVYGGHQDYDCCQRSYNKCDKPAMFNDPRLEMEFCSKQCADAEIADRAGDAEFERVAEITSGGQV